MWGLRRNASRGIQREEIELGGASRFDCYASEI